MRSIALFLVAAATSWAAGAQDRDSYEYREGYRRGWPKELAMPKGVVDRVASILARLQKS